MTDFFGHDRAEASFLGAFARGRVHHAWLLAGPEGMGKMHFARRVAGHILTRGASDGRAPLGPDPATPGAKMLAEGSHPDCHILTLEPRDDKEQRKREDGKPFELARNIRIGQVRALQKRFTMRPSLSDCRVVIIDPVDLLERGGANALLKSLEEPPANTFFLLVAHNPGRLLPTIRSRCLTLAFPALDDAQMEIALRAARPDLGDEDCAALVALGQGAPGQALAYAGLDIASLARVMERIADSGDRDQSGRVALGQMVSGKPQRERFQAFLRFAPSFAATRIRRLSGEHMAHAIEARREMIELAGRSTLLNLDPQSVGFQIGGLLARLAPPR